MEGEGGGGGYWRCGERRKTAGDRKHATMLKSTAMKGTESGGQTKKKKKKNQHPKKKKKKKKKKEKKKRGEKLGTGQKNVPQRNSVADVGRGRGKETVE